MASATQTLTVGAGDWVYIDKSGAPHNVTTGQSCVFYLTDTSSTIVEYSITSVTDGTQTLNCDDGGEVQFIADAGTANSGASTNRFIGPLTDAMDGVATVGVEGRFLMSYNNGPVQNWVPASITVDDIDNPSTFTATWEDQFGNVMTWDAIPCA